MTNAADTDRHTDRGTGCLTEVQHGGRVGAGPVVGQQADLSLPLLLLDPQLGSPVSVRTAAAEEDENGPQQPEP